jgi:hypothetical protein
MQMYMKNTLQALSWKRIRQSYIPHTAIAFRPLPGYSSMPCIPGIPIWCNSSGYTTHGLLCFHPNQKGNASGWMPAACLKRCLQTCPYAGNLFRIHISSYLARPLYPCSGTGSTVVLKAQGLDIHSGQPLNQPSSCLQRAALERPAKSYGFLVSKASNGKVSPAVPSRNSPPSGTQWGSIRLAAAGLTLPYHVASVSSIAFGGSFQCPICKHDEG